MDPTLYQTFKILRIHGRRIIRSTDRYRQSNAITTYPALWRTQINFVE